MSKSKDKSVNHNSKMKIAYVAFIMILLLIILFATLLMFSENKKSDALNGESMISSDITTETSVSGVSTELQATSEEFTAETVTTVSSLQSDINSETSDIDNNKVNSIELTFYNCNLNVGESVMPMVTMLPDTADLSENWESSDESVAVVDWQGNITAVNNGVCTITVSSVSNPEVKAEVKVTVGDEVSSTVSEETTVPESGEPVYIKGILIANKTYALPEDYNPGLDSETESAFYTLSEAAAEEGLDIWLASGFRSFDDQDRIYHNYVDSYGQETADTFSARPGHSEHQTGLAIDVNTIDDSFAGTPEAIWLEEHAHEYGFIIRYPKGKENITGYKYEPWHIRYLGVEKATEVYNSGLTLEEFLGIDSVYQN